MKTIILIFLGGGSGAVTRYVATILGGRVLGAAHNFYSILSVNVVGSLLMGMLVGYMWRHNTNLNETTRHLIATGFLGGFTTFSAFSLDFINLWMKGEWGTAIGYAIVSVGMSVMAIALGIYLVRGS